jgi:cardiolipin synthase
VKLLPIATVLLILLYTVNLISIISLLFFDRKQVSVTLGWLMVFVFLPVAGFILYFFFGSTAKLSFLLKKYTPPQFVLDHEVSARKNLKAILTGQIKLPKSTHSDFKDLIIFNLKNAKSVYTQDNKPELLVDGPAKFARMNDEIKNAKESINVLYYIIKSRDMAGRDFIALLAKKAREGVKVRVIYDGLGCISTRYSHFKELIASGGQVYVYLPSRLKSLLLINHRMHRKMVIIDGKYAYTGGINVGDDYMGLDSVKSPWRDTSIRLAGSCVKHIQYYFE